LTLDPLQEFGNLSASVCIRVEACPGGAVGQCPLRRGGLRGGRGWGGAAEQVQRGLRAQFAAGRRDFFQVPGHCADDGAARAAGLDGAVQFTDSWTDRMGCELGRCLA
jgi:hypothetical protein